MRMLEMEGMVDIDGGTTGKITPGYMEWGKGSGGYGWRNKRENYARHRARNGDRFTLRFM